MRQLIENSWLKRNWLAITLWPLSVLYSGIVWLRLRAYSKGYFKTSQIKVPVIVVGNISVGGTGKTPLVIFLVNKLTKAGYKVGVVSRGYGRQSEKEILVVTDKVDVRQSGDEAQLIQQQTDAVIALGADRVAAAEKLVQATGCNIIVCDDGFQHLRLERDFNIAVVDAMRGFGNGWCLPAGFLREPISALRRADAVVINGQADEKLQNRIAQYQTYQMTLVLSKLYCLHDMQYHDLSVFSGKKVHAVAGIGNPTRFFQALKAKQISLIEHVYADHHEYLESDLEFDDDVPIVMTEKDAVKCHTFRDQLKKRIYVAPASMQLGDGLFKQILQSIKKERK